MMARNRGWLTLEEVMEAEPRITCYGLGMWWGDIKPGTSGRAKFKAEREQLRREGDVFEAVCGFIVDNLEKRQTVDKGYSHSYSLKHDVETALDIYVANGVLIAAMVACGFRYTETFFNSPNAWFNVTVGSVRAVHKQNDKLRRGWARAEVGNDQAA
jgi:hypothetical protein